MSPALRNFQLDPEERLIYMKHKEQLITKINLDSYKNLDSWVHQQLHWSKISSGRDQKSVFLTSFPSNSDHQSILGTIKGETTQKST